MRAKLFDVSTLQGTNPEGTEENHRLQHGEYWMSLTSKLGFDLCRILCYIWHAQFKSEKQDEETLIFYLGMNKKTRKITKMDEQRLELNIPAGSALKGGGAFTLISQTHGTGKRSAATHHIY